VSSSGMPRHRLPPTQPVGAPRERYPWEEEVLLRQAEWFATVAGRRMKWKALCSERWLAQSPVPLTSSALKYSVSSQRGWRGSSTRVSRMRRRKTVQRDTGREWLLGPFRRPTSSTNVFDCPLIPPRDTESASRTLRRRAVAAHSASASDGCVCRRSSARNRVGNDEPRPWEAPPGTAVLDLAGPTRAEATL
jgi:hypothetical protein